MEKPQSYSLVWELICVSPLLVLLLAGLGIDTINLTKVLERLGILFP